ELAAVDPLELVLRAVRLHDEGLAAGAGDLRRELLRDQIPRRVARARGETNARRSRRLARDQHPQRQRQRRDPQREREPAAAPGALPPAALFAVRGQRTPPHSCTPGSALTTFVSDRDDTRWRAAAFAGLALLCVPVFFWGLGRYSVVNADEAIYHAIAEHMV